MKDLLEVVRSLKNIFLIENKTSKPFFDNSCIPLLKRGQVIIPTAHYSDSPLLRRPIIPTAHFSDNPLFRQKWSKVV
jgi:hypothetical protein